GRRTPPTFDRQRKRMGYSGGGKVNVRAGSVSARQPAPGADASGSDRHTPWIYFLASSSSMALTTLSESGFSAGSSPATISPLRPIRNLVKFHWISPPNFGFVSLLVRNLYNSDWPSPLTTTLDSMSNLTLYVFVQKSLISALVPGSCLPNSLAGTPTMARPL